MRSLLHFLLSLLLGAGPLAAHGTHLAPALRPAGTLDVAPTSLGGFTTAVGTPSAYQSLVVNASGLTSDVTATASSGYEVTLDPRQGSVSSASGTLPAPGGLLVNVALYVRMTGAVLGPLAGTISFSSPGLAPVTVALSGTVTATPTTNPANTVTSCSPTTGVAGTTFTVHFYGQNFVPGVSLGMFGNGAGFSTGYGYPTTFLSSSHVTALVTLPGADASTQTYFTLRNPEPGGYTTTQFVYFTIALGPPVLTSFTPLSGPVGTAVTLTCTGFSRGGRVRFSGGAAADLFYPPEPTLTSMTVTVPAAATTGPITVTTPGGTAVSALPFTVTPSVYEDFEQGTKTSYAAASVALRSGGWTLRETLLGTTAGADKFNGSQSARLRGGGSLEMDTDKPNGAGVVTVSAATYATETGVSFVPEISTDGGITYISLLGGAAPPVLTGTLTAYSFTANRSGPVRLRFSSTNTAATANPRLNLDDLFISNYSSALAASPGQELAALVAYPNPARSQVALSTAADEVRVLDLLGRPLASPCPLAAGQALPLAVPAGLYLLRVRRGDQWRTLRLQVE